MSPNWNSGCGDLTRFSSPSLPGGSCLAEAQRQIPKLLRGCLGLWSTPVTARSNWPFRQNTSPSFSKVEAATGNLKFKTLISSYKTGSIS